MLQQAGYLQAAAAVTVSLCRHAAVHCSYDVAPQPAEHTAAPVPWHGIAMLAAASAGLLYLPPGTPSARSRSTISWITCNTGKLKKRYVKDTKRTACL